MLEATYTFERTVIFNDGEGKTSTNFIDLYKIDCFMLEAKQGSDKATVTKVDVLRQEKEKTKTATAKEMLAWPKTLAEQAQAVQRALELHECPATAQDLNQQFKPVAKAQQPQRLQQIDNLLQTLHGLDLLRKTEQVQYVK